MDLLEEPEKHFIIKKCKKCPFIYRSYYSSNRIYCKHFDAYMKQIELKGKKFPKWCPLDDFIKERCDTIQLKKKKMLDNIKRKKRCRK